MDKPVVTMDHYINIAPDHRGRTAREWWDLYHEATTSGNSAYSLSGTLSVSKKALLNWRAGKAAPDVVNDVRDLAHLFPVTIRDLATTLRPLNRLAMYSLLSGHISANNKATFNTRNGDEVRYVRAQLRGLNDALALGKRIPHHLHTTTAPNKTTNILLGRGGKHVVRFMKIVGIPAGAKVGQPVHFPWYLVETARLMQRGRLKGDDLAHAQTLLSDAIEVAQFVSSHRDPKTRVDRVTLRLPYLRKKSHAEALGSEAALVSRALGILGARERPNPRGYTLHRQGGPRAKKPGPFSYSSSLWVDRLSGK